MSFCFLSAANVVYNSGRAASKSYNYKGSEARGQFISFLDIEEFVLVTRSRQAHVLYSNQFQNKVRQKKFHHVNLANFPVMQNTTITAHLFAVFRFRFRSTK